jgi:hypothetical protein
VVSSCCDELEFLFAGVEVVDFLGVEIEPVVGVGVTSPDVYGMVGDADTILVVGLWESFVNDVLDLGSVGFDCVGDGAEPSRSELVVWAKFYEDNYLILFFVNEVLEGCGEVF